MIRSGLLLTAATTVAVPGLLAVLGVVSHGQVSGAAARAGLAGAVGSAALSSPVASSTTRVRGDLAGVQQPADVPVTVLSRLTARQQALGRKLLARAAVAAQATSYQGTEQISQSGVAGQISVTSQIWHQGGGQTVVQTSAPADVSDTASDAPEGVFGVTSALVTLLGQHYVTAYQSTGSAAGRAALVVMVYRFDGSLAAQYWLDRQTMLPLRRELFDPASRVISADSFVRVQVGAQADLTVAAAGPQAGWVTAASPARSLASLAAQGWKLPASLSGLSLYAAASTGAGRGQVTDLEYSDGLCTVSLLVQQGNLTTDLPGWQRVRLAGQQAYVSGRSVAWAGPGLVYTMVADAPAATVAQAVAGLPASQPPGVLTRLGRGLARLARIADPFG